ncbi:hypothetical protein BaRGS_00025938, partial [Batillaria attramentaria]
VWDSIGKKRQANYDLGSVVMKKLQPKDQPDGTRIVVSKTGGNFTLSGLRQLRQERSLCDVVFKVERREIWAHRNILTINSDYFRAMFVDGFHETESTEIELDSIEVNAAEALVDFMYTGQFILTRENVQNMIMAADQWQMGEVKSICVEFMERQIDTENCLGVLEFSVMYRCESLTRKAQQIIKQRFPVVARTVEFLTLSTERLWEIISFGDLYLGHRGEDVVLEAVMRWFEHDPAGRRSDLPRVLRKVRLANTTKECRNRLLDQNTFVQASEELLTTIEQQMQKPVHLRNAQTTLYVIGGFLQSRTGPQCPRLKGVEKLDPLTHAWTKCADLPMLSSGAVAFNLHGHLFCSAYEPINMGRAAAAVATETGIFEYNIINDEWVDAKENFSEEALDSIDNCLQAAGDIAVCERTNTIYTVSNSEVTSISVVHREGSVYVTQRRLLPWPREFFSEGYCYHSAVVLDERLYVIGGDERTQGSENVPTNLVIMFDPERNRWVRKANLLEPRAKLDAVVFGIVCTSSDGHIYAVGGFNNFRLTTVECYDPRSDRWTHVAPMEKFRSHHKVLVMDNKIWAIGGKSYAAGNGGARKVITHCEVYDPASNRWTEGPQMKAARCGFAAVAI